MFTTGQSRAFGGIISQSPQPSVSSQTANPPLPPPDIAVTQQNSPYTLASTFANGQLVTLEDGVVVNLPAAIGTRKTVTFKRVGFAAPPQLNPAGADTIDTHPGALLLQQGMMAFPIRDMQLGIWLVP